MHQRGYTPTVSLMVFSFPTKIIILLIKIEKHSSVWNDDFTTCIFSVNKTTCISTECSEIARKFINKNCMAEGQMSSAERRCGLCRQVMHSSISLPSLFSKDVYSCGLEYLYGRNYAVHSTYNEIVYNEVSVIMNWKFGLLNALYIFTYSVYNEIRI